MKTNKKRSEIILPDLKLSYEVVGGFTPLFMDMIVRNFGKGVDVISAIKGGELSFFIKQEVLEKRFLEKTSFHLTNEENFKNFLNRFNIAKEELKYCFKENIRIENSFDLVLELFETFEEFIKYYNIIDFNLSRENEDILKSKNLVVYNNYKKIGELRNNLRKFVNEFIISEGSYFVKIVKNIARKFEISEEDIFFYTKEDVVKIYKGDILTVEDVKKRKKAFVIVRHKDEINYYFGDEISYKIDSLKKEQQDVEIGSLMIKGNVAFGNGIKRGRVKLFPRVDFNKVEFQIVEVIDSLSKGEDVILVSEVTTPEMLVLFERVGGIVTDYGGLNSHAAIIAREFQIPCIVGTEVATRVLKDGDEIEMDTENGTINILASLRL